MDKRKKSTLIPITLLGIWSGVGGLPVAAIARTFGHLPLAETYIGILCVLALFFAFPLHLGLRIAAALAGSDERFPAVVATILWAVTASVTCTLLIYAVA
jgi:choline-glycine betaine transporter